MCYFELCYFIIAMIVLFYFPSTEKLGTFLLFVE